MTEPLLEGQVPFLTFAYNQLSFLEPKSLFSWVKAIIYINRKYKYYCTIYKKYTETEYFKTHAGNPEWVAKRKIEVAKRKAYIADCIKVYIDHLA